MIAIYKYTKTTESNFYKESLFLERKLNSSLYGYYNYRVSFIHRIDGKKDSSLSQDLISLGSNTYLKLSKRKLRNE